MSNNPTSPRTVIRARDEELKHCSPLTPAKESFPRAPPATPAAVVKNIPDRGIHHPTAALRTALPKAPPPSDLSSCMPCCFSFGSGRGWCSVQVRETSEARAPGHLNTGLYFIFLEQFSVSSPFSAHAESPEAASLINLPTRAATKLFS